MFKKNLFAIVYSVLLTAFTVYVLMDTLILILLLRRQL